MESEEIVKYRVIRTTNVPWLREPLKFDLNHVHSSNISLIWTNQHTRINQSMNSKQNNFKHNTDRFCVFSILKQRVGREWKIEGIPRFLLGEGLWWWTKFCIPHHNDFSIEVNYPNIVTSHSPKFQFENLQYCWKYKNESFSQSTNKQNNEQNTDS